MSTRFFLVLLFLLPVYCFAGMVKGRITDKSKETLPFATVFVQGTTTGTSANAQGLYQLVLPPGSYKIVCQYMGFKQGSFTAVISGDETLEHDFALEEQSLQMREHVVKSSEDPGMYIMRKVIAKRSFHLSQVKAFKTDIYLKGVLRSRQTPQKFLGQKVDAADMGLDSSRKGIIYLCEELATYYSKDDEDRTVIHSVRESGDPSGLGFSQFPPVISFYENNIRLSEQINPRGFISPLNDLGFNFYKYRLEGDFQEGGNTIFKISVTPKRQYEPLFSGVIYIVDNEWAIHSLNLLVTKKNNLEFLDTLRVDQLYLPLAPDTWVIKQQVLYPTLKIFGFDFTGNFVTVYNEQEVNGPVPDSIFNSKIVSSYDRTANKKDTSYWTGTRPVPLEKDESKDYVVKDSLRLRYEDPLYQDSMRRKDNKIDLMDLVMSGVSHRGKKDKYTFRTNALLTMVNYNTIEGLNIAPRITGSLRVDSFTFVTLTAAVRYGFENTHFNAIGRIAWSKRAKEQIGRYWNLGIEAGKYVYQFNYNNPVEPLSNTVSTLFYRKNYFKLYERWNGAVFFTRNLGNGLRWNLQLGFQKRLPLDNTTDFSFAKDDVGGFTENLPAELKHLKFAEHNAVIARLGISYQPGITYTRYPDYVVPHRSNWPVFTLNYVKGIPSILGSETDFDKWRLGVRDDISLRLLGTLDYNLVAGGFFNTRQLSIPDLHHLYGNQVLLATPYLESFQLAPYYLYSNQEPLYAEAHLEWHLKGFLTNKIPLLRQLRWYLVTGANGFYANDRLYHAEAYVGIDNLGYDKFRILRLDFVQGWSSFGEQIFAFRVNIAAGGLLNSLGLTDTNGEW